MSKQHNLLRRLKHERSLHFMILPIVLIVLLFKYLPMYGVIIAFKNFNPFDGIMNSPWAANNGFEHFIDFFSLPGSLKVIRNTLNIAILKLFILSLPPVILAILLNEIKAVGFKKVSQTISYLPHFISWIVIGGIIYNLLSPYNGPVNILLMRMNVINEPVNFIANNSFFYPLLILSHLWKEVGWASIIYLAVISTIDPNLYEAVDIDGGGRLRKILHVTVPHLLNTFVIIFILNSGSIMSGFGETFDQCYVLGNVANRDVSDILGTYILRIGLEQARFSFATAAGLFTSVVNLILLLSANFLSKRLTGRSLY